MIDLVLQSLYTLASLALLAVPPVAAWMDRREGK